MPNVRRAVLVLVLGLGVPAAASTPGVHDRIEHEGISVDLSIEVLNPGESHPAGLVEGDDARFRFRITDPTGAPISGAYPAAWMDHLVRGIESDARLCQEKVEEFVGGSLFSQAELDLNVYYVLALNDDATITVVDPLFGFGGTKLLAMVALDAPGEDWVLTGDRQRVFVSMPDAGAVAVVDTATWEVVERLPVDGGRPGGVALQPDGAYLWTTYVGEEDRSGVVVFEVSSMSPVASINTGRGTHDIVFSDDSRFAYVTNELEGTLTVIDSRTLRGVASVSVGRPVSVAYSPLAGSVYVLDETAGTITVVSSPSHEVVARIATEPGSSRIRFAPDNRYAFVVNPTSDALFIFDSASNRVVQEADVGLFGSGPDQVAFSDELAYIRFEESEIVLAVPLDVIGGEGETLSLIDVPAGQRSFGEGRLPSRADGIVQAPGANAVLLANPADQAIYFYKEGMAAPMGSFNNYGRQPRAVLVVDRSLKESVPGVYETVARLRRPGQHSLAFYLDTPQIVHCFDVAVAANPEIARKRLAARGVEVEFLSAAHDVEPAKPHRVRLRLTHPVTGEPLTEVGDLRVMAYKSPGIRQHRAWATHVGGGIYEAELILPTAESSYSVFVECASLNLPYHRTRPLILRTLAADDPD